MRNALPTLTALPAELRYVSVADLARSIGRSRAFVYRRIADGDLQPVKVFGAVRIPYTVAVKWIESNVGAA